MPRTRVTKIDNVQAVGQRIKEQRDRRGMTLRELSFEGCTAPYLSAIERGRRVPQGCLTTEQRRQSMYGIECWGRFWVARCRSLESARPGHGSRSRRLQCCARSRGHDRWLRLGFQCGRSSDYFLAHGRPSRRRRSVRHCRSLRGMVRSSSGRGCELRTTNPVPCICRSAAGRLRPRHRFRPS